MRRSKQLCLSIKRFDLACPQGCAVLRGCLDLGAVAASALGIQ
jgi:hypothetical protein